MSIFSYAHKPFECLLYESCFKYFCPFQLFSAFPLLLCLYIYCCLVARHVRLCKPTRLFAHGISQAKNTEVDCHFLLQLTHTHTHTHTHIGQQSFHWKNILQIYSPPCTLPFHSPNDIFWGSELNISIVLFINPWLQVISPFQPQWTLAVPQLCWIPPLFFTCNLHTSATRYNVSSMRAQSMPAVINSLGCKQYLVHNRYPKKIFFLLNEWKNKLTMNLFYLSHNSVCFYYLTAQIFLQF